MANKVLVLVIEDEPLLMMALLDFIEQAGCEAISVRDMDAAIGLLETRTDIRIVITDLDVKGSVGGIKFAAGIRDRWPPIELILTSSMPQPPQLADLPVRSVYVDKPFSEREFLDALRKFAA